MRYVTIVSNFFLAAIFMFTGIDKLFHYKGFITALSSYIVIPDGTAEYLALPIILSEIWIALGLLFRAWRKTAALISAVAMAIFSAALIVNYIYAPESICGCWFSITLGTATITHILMNLTLLGVAIVIWLDRRSEVNAQTTGSGTDPIHLHSSLEA